MGSKEGHIYTIEEGGAEMGNREPSEFFPTKKKKFLTCYVSQLFEYRFINILPKEGGGGDEARHIYKIGEGPSKHFEVGRRWLEADHSGKQLTTVAPTLVRHHG